MWVTTAATPYIVVNNSHGCFLPDDLEEHGVDRLGKHHKSADHLSPTMWKTQVDPQVASNRSSSRCRSVANSAWFTFAEYPSESGDYNLIGAGQIILHWSVDPLEQLAVSVSIGAVSRWTLGPNEQMPLQVSPVFHDSSGDRNNDSNESRWRRYEHDVPPLPDVFMTRYVRVLMYLADVLEADEISALLFGRWPPRYHQRARANRFDRRRRRRRRRFAMYVCDIGMMFRGAWRTNRSTSCCVEDLPGAAVVAPTFALASAPAVPATSSVVSAPSSLGTCGSDIDHLEVMSIQV